jgi:hypothetical protein
MRAVRERCGRRARFEGVFGSTGSGDVRGLGSREGIGAAASHCEDVSRWVGSAIGGCVGAGDEGSKTATLDCELVDDCAKAR